MKGFRYSPVIQRHQGFFVPLAVDFEFSPAEIKRGYIQLLKFRQSQAIRQEQDQDGFVSSAGFFPVLIFLRSQMAAGRHRVQHNHHFIILESLNFMFPGILYPDRVKFSGDILRYHPLPVKVLKQDRKR